MRWSNGLNYFHPKLQAGEVIGLAMSIAINVKNVPRITSVTEAGIGKQLINESGDMALGC
jgi:hypothetical protein